MKTYSVNLIAARMGMAAANALRLLNKAGIKPILTAKKGNGTYRYYSPKDVRPFLSRFRSEQDKALSAKLHEEADKLAVKVSNHAPLKKEADVAVKPRMVQVKGYIKSNGTVVPPSTRAWRGERKRQHEEATLQATFAKAAFVEATTNVTQVPANDALLVRELAKLNEAVRVLVAAVEQNTKVINENGLAALEVATRPSQPERSNEQH